MYNSCEYLPLVKQYKTNLFREHGSYSVRWQGDQLFVEPMGMFNLEGAQTFNRHIEAIVETGHLTRGNVSNYLVIWTH